MRRIPITALLPLLLALVASPAPASSDQRDADAALPESIDPAEIPSYKRLSPTLAVGGTPKPELLAKLPSMGVKTVIDLRPEAEGTGPEKALVEGLGMRYVQVPVTPQTFCKSDAEAVGKAIQETTDGSVLLHCSTSNRVGGVLAVLEAAKGKGIAEALAAGKNAGLRSGPMEDAVHRVLDPPHPAKDSGKK